MEHIRYALDDGAYEMTRAHARDAGADIRTPIKLVIHPGKALVVDTGVHVEIPEGYGGVLISKSGLNINHGVTTTGLIDAGYSGSIKVRVANGGEDVVTLERGDKITQLVILPIVTPGFEQVDEISGGERGENGFGSTGR